ncbi:MAG: membrane protein [Melioribacteraceae bacterium]|nr:MAG: membrane protein [Melioribacteraceae bacterium]
MLFLGEISALAAALLWSFNSISLTEATVRVGSVLVNIARMFFASFYLIITILLLGASFDLSSSQYFNLIISGFIGLIAGDTFLLKSLEQIGARLGMLLMSLAPPISAVLAFIFLNEVLSLTAVIGIAVTLLGVAFVILDKGQKAQPRKFNLAGVVFGILAATGQATGLIFAKEAFYEGPLDEFVAAFIRIFTSTIALYFVARLFGKIKNPVRVYKNDPVAFKHTIWASILGPYLGITASLLAVAHTKVGIAATLMATMPILMLPISKYYYKEKLTWKAILGAFIAVGGVSLLFINDI